MNICELPVGVASKIVSDYFGEPEYMRLKHKKIQRKFKPYFTKEEREECEYFEQMSDCRELK